LKIDPKSPEFHMQKFRLLVQIDNMQGIGRELKTMSGIFPDAPQVKTALIDWYMAQGDLIGAEGFLRQLAGGPTGPLDGHLALVQFLKLTRGADVAGAELDGLIQANRGTAKAEVYETQRATLDFEAGRTAEAIASIKAIIAAAAPSDQTRSVKGTLAQMLNHTGNIVGARALAEEVLAEDPSNVAALKMRAGWFINDDKAGDAIIDLRTALDQSPRDPEIMTLLAAAYERDGSLNLAGDQLAKAVEASGAAPEEALRYASFLMRQGSSQVVEAVLTNAHQVSPKNPDILRALAEFYIGESRWPRAQEAVDALGALDLPEGKTQLSVLQASVLAGQNRLEESLAILEASGNQSTAALIMLLQSDVRAGKIKEARKFLNGLLVKSPKDKHLRLISASLDAQLGNTDTAEATYRALIAENPAAETPIQLLYAQLLSLGRAADAMAVLDAGIAAQPKSFRLLWMKASALEQSGKVDDAIVIYDKLYGEDKDNTVLANNLASLIANNRKDDTSLARAEVIARRLRGSAVPAYQDTYGWIAFRRGDLEEAQSHLEAAAKGLPDDPLTQFHLGMLYAKLGRVPEAVSQLELALSLGAKSSNLGNLPQMNSAEGELDRLRSTQNTDKTETP